MSKIEIKTIEYNILMKFGKIDKINKFHNTVLLLNYKGESYIGYLNVYFEDKLGDEESFIKTMFNEPLELKDKKIIIKKVKFFKKILENIGEETNKEKLFNETLRLNIDLYNKEYFKKELDDFLEDIDDDLRLKIIKHYGLKITRTEKIIKI